jgi:DNA-binding MarR family transcriptional regulator
MATPSPASLKSNAPALDLDALPGNAIRRLQQIAVAIFLQEAESTGVTPVQFAVLQALANTPEVDQRTLSRSIGFDTSTLASVIDRLEARGAVQRRLDPADRRVRLLALTPQGQELLHEVVPAMWRAQERILQPLAEKERTEFMRLLLALVRGNNALSRAPSEA